MKRRQNTKLKASFAKLAGEYRKRQLWEVLTDADVFGVRLEDGRIAYCCVMGNGGNHQGLGVYIGERGYRSYLESLTLGQNGDRKRLFETIAMFDCTQLSFSDGGLEYWRHLPHVALSPNNCTDEDLDVLCQCLTACNALSTFIAVAGGDPVALGFDEEGEYPDMEGGKDALLLTRKDNGYLCSTIQLPRYVNDDVAQMEEAADAVLLSAGLRLSMEKISRLKKTGILQCRLIHYPEPSKEKEDLYASYAVCLLVVNKSSGMMLKPELSYVTREGRLADILSNLCREIEGMGRCPLQISVSDDITKALLATFCKQLGIKLVRERMRMRYLEEAWESLYDFTSN